MTCGQWETPVRSCTVNPDLPPRTGPPRPRRRWYPAALVALGGVFLAGPVTGMFIRTQALVISRSTDGKSTLQQEHQQGPEGGGSLTYRLTGPAGAASFVVSSDFSPGGGSRPQRVSAAECTRRLAELSRQLNVRGFSGITIHAERCQNKLRQALVTTDPNG